MTQQDFPEGPAWMDGISSQAAQDELLDKIRRAQRLEEAPKIQVPDGTVALYILYEQKGESPPVTDLFLTNVGYVEDILDIVGTVDNNDISTRTLKIPHYEREEQSSGLLFLKNIQSIKVMDLEDS